MRRNKMKYLTLVVCLGLLITGMGLTDTARGETIQGWIENIADIDLGTDMGFSPGVVSEDLNVPLTSTAVVPIPGALLLLGAGVIRLAFYRRRKQI
ncbi:MAG: hypothetical protein PHW74_04070 [Desulfobacca sp.]|nr:hypothetical protein [Desulfobacca sp.]